MEIRTPKTMDVMFLFGAGASKPAGIPTIDEMTEEFLQKPFKRNKFQNNIDKIASNVVGNIESSKLGIISQVALDYYGKGDLEFMMTLLGQLEDERSIDFFVTRYPKLKDIMAPAKHISEKKEIIKYYRNIIQDFIRNACENITNIDYLWSLSGLITKTPLNIFTLNYDGIIENFCEKNHLEYRDGFDPHWNPKRFEDPNSKINLYKLHGSLYWLRTKSGKIVKTPIRGIDIESMKYIDGDSLSEMMLYPQLQKDKQLEVFSWLDRKFKDELNKSDICVAIGYSFRDDEIKNSMLESLSSNPRLWLVIVSPHATKHKTSFFHTDDNVSTKIVSIDMGVEEALRERNLHLNLQALERAIQHEEETWLSQQKSQIRLDDQWRFIIENYLKIGHHGRINWIVEKLYKEKFIDISGNFPNSIEGIVGPYSFGNALDYYIIGDKNRSEIWKKVFLDSCIALEFKLFDQEKPTLQTHNPITKDELPFWCNRSGGSFTIEYYVDKLNVELKPYLTELADGPLKENLSKLVETLSLITFKEYLKSGGYRTLTPEEFLAEYQKKDLGMKKWASLVVNLIAD